MLAHAHTPKIQKENMLIINNKVSTVFVAEKSGYDPNSLVINKKLLNSTKEQKCGYQLIFLCKFGDGLSCILLYLVAPSDFRKPDLGRRGKWGGLN